MTELDVILILAICSTAATVVAAGFIIRIYGFVSHL